MLKRTTPTLKTESLRRPKNADVRSREYLRPDEVERLISTAKSIGRHKNRDTLLISIMFRHGLRVNEALYLNPRLEEPTLVVDRRLIHLANIPILCIHQFL